MTWNPFNRNMVTMTPLPAVNPSARTPGYNGGYTRRILPGGGVPGPLPVVKRVPTAAAPAPAAPPQPGLLGAPGISDGLLAASGAMGKFAGPSRTPVSLGAAIGPTLQAFAKGQREGELYDYKMNKLQAEDRMLAQAAAGREQLAQQYPHMAEAIKGGVVDPKDRFKEVDGVLIDTWAQGAPGAKMPGKKLDPTKEYFTDSKTGDQRLTRKGVDKRHSEWRNTLKPSIEKLGEINRKMSLVLRATEMANGTADIAAVNAYQRMIDDGVVRSEDIRLQGEALSVYAELKRWAQNKKQGDILDPTLRSRMSEMARALAEETVGNTMTEVSAWKSVVDQEVGLDWNKVFPPSLMRWADKSRYTNPANSGSTKLQGSVVDLSPKPSGSGG